MDGDTFPRFTSHYSYSLPCACTLVLPYLAAGGRKLDRPAGKSCYIQMQQRARTRPPDCRAWWYFWQEARTRPYTGSCRSRQSLFLRDRRSWWPHRVGAHGQASSCSGSGSGQSGWQCDDTFLPCRYDRVYHDASTLYLVDLVAWPEVVGTSSIGGYGPYGMMRPWIELERGRRAKEWRSWPWRDRQSEEGGRPGRGRAQGGSWEWEGGGRRRLESTISVLHLSSATVRAVGAIFFFQHVPAALASACHTTLLEVRIPPCAQPHAVTAVVRPSNVVLLLLLSCPVLSSPVLSCPSSRSRWFEEVSPPQPSSLQTTDSSNYNSSIAKQAAINKFRSGAASRVLTLQSIDLIMKWFYCKLLIEIATPQFTNERGEVWATGNTSTLQANPAASQLPRVRLPHNFSALCSSSLNSLMQVQSSANTYLMRCALDRSRDIFGQSTSF